MNWFSYFYILSILWNLRCHVMQEFKQVKSWCLKQKKCEYAVVVVVNYHIQLVGFTLPDLKTLEHLLYQSTNPSYHTQHLFSGNKSWIHRVSNSERYQLASSLLECLRFCVSTKRHCEFLCNVFISFLITCSNWPVLFLDQPTQTQGSCENAGLVAKSTAI